MTEGNNQYGGEAWFTACGEEELHPHTAEVEVRAAGGGSSSIILTVHVSAGRMCFTNIVMMSHIVILH